MLVLYFAQMKELVMLSSAVIVLIVVPRCIAMPLYKTIKGYARLSLRCPYDHCQSTSPTSGSWKALTMCDKDSEACSLWLSGSGFLPEIDKVSIVTERITFQPISVRRLLFADSQIFDASCCLFMKSPFPYIFYRNYWIHSNI